MKWTSKPKPELGDIKEKIKFALFPTKVEGLWLWFEKYIRVYEYKTYYYQMDEVVSSGIFTEKYYTKNVEAIGWRTIDKKLIK